jgi:hypothetical protein
MERSTLVNVTVAAVGAGTAMFLLSRTGQAQEVTHDPLPDNVMTGGGWHGTVEQRTKVQRPKFANNTAGHIAFVHTMVPALMGRGLSHESAMLFTAHAARETGWGKAIWNNNIGNIKIGSTLRGPWFWMTDARKFTDKYRAYDTIDDGLDDDLSLVRNSTRYRKSWAMLQTGDPNWYGQLGLDGYYEGPPDPNHPGQHTNHNAATIIPVQHEYDQIVALARKYENSGPGAVPSTPGVLPSNNTFTWVEVLGAVGVLIVGGAIIVGRND